MKGIRLIYNHNRGCWTCGSQQGDVKCKGIQTVIGIKFGNRSVGRHRSARAELNQNHM